MQGQKKKVLKASTITKDKETTYSKNPHCSNSILLQFKKSMEYCKKAQYPVNLPNIKENKAFNVQKSPSPYYRANMQRLLKKKNKPQEQQAMYGLSYLHIQNKKHAVFFRL